MDIFISRPNWVAEVYSKGLEIFLTRLTDLGFKTRTLGTTDYPTKAPLDGVIEIMSQCKGAVILGYPQISIDSGSIKDNALEGPIMLPTEGQERGRWFLRCFNLHFNYIPHNAL